VGYGKPVFEQQSYTVTLAENILPTDSIFRAQALDDDSDLIVYSIIDSQYDSLFSIDSLTGEVSLLSALNYEEANQYKLTVFADDGIFGATMELVVDVTDVTEYQASGRVGYWSDINHGIQGSIHFTSSDNNYAVSTNINPDTGTFFLDDLMPGDYIVEVQTDSLTGGSHKSADALAAMRLSAGLIDNPDSYSLIAADIDQNGRVTGTDALEILRIAIDHPAAKAAEFVVLDEQNGPLAIQANNVNYSNELTVSVTDNMTDLDLVAVLLGDVDGNYTDLI